MRLGWVAVIAGVAMLAGCAPHSTTDGGDQFIPPGDGDGGGEGGGLPGVPSLVSSLFWSGVLDAVPVEDHVVASTGYGIVAYAPGPDGWAEAAHVAAWMDGPCRVFYADPWVYVAAGTSGLHLLTVSNPASPRLVSTYLGSGQRLVDVAVVEQRAFLADENYGLRVLDIADTQNPLLTGGVPAARATCLDMSAQGTRAYVGTDEGKVIVADTEGLTPRLLGTATVSEQGGVADLCVGGTLVYALVSDRGLVILNAAVPARIEELAELPVEDGTSVSLVGGLLFVSRDGPSGAHVDLVNVSDPLAPAVVGRCTPPRALRVHAGGSTACVAGGPAGVCSVEVTDQDSVRIAIPFAGPTDVRAIASTARHALVGYKEGLAVLDVSNRLAAVVLLTHATQRAVTRVALGEAVGCAVCAGDGEGEPTLVSVDNTELASPTIGAATALAGLTDACLVGGTAYCACGADGVRPVDLSISSAPVVGDPIALPGVSADVIAAGAEALYVGDQAAHRLVTVSLADGHDVTGSLDLPAAPVSLRRVGSNLLAACGDQGLAVVGLNDAAAPVLLGATVVPGFASSALMDTGAAYLAAGEPGLRLVSLEDEEHPAPYVFLDTPGAALDVAVDTGLVYIADRDALLICEQ